LWNDKLKGIKIRKGTGVNAPVLAHELFIGASPIFDTWSREKQDSYFADALKYVEGWYGKHNIISAAVHRDETTLHLSVFLVSANEKGKLSSGRFLDDLVLQQFDKDDKRKNRGHDSMVFCRLILQKR